MNLRQKAILLTELATLLEAGFSLQHSLVMAGRSGHPQLQRHLSEMAQAIAAGSDLATTWSAYPQYFDHWTIALVRLAEYSGALTIALRGRAADCDRQQRQIRLYRSLNLSLLSVVLGCLPLLAFLLHRPLLVKLEFWLAILTILISTAIGLQWLETHPISRTLYQTLLALPFIGTILQARTVLYFTELALPLACGVPLLTALDLLREHLPQLELQSALKVAVHQVRAGRPLSVALQGKLPAIAMQMLCTGEEVGDLADLLVKMAEHYEAELETTLRQLQSLMRPIAVIALGLFVLLLGIQMLGSLINRLPG